MGIIVRTLESNLKDVVPEPLLGDGGQALTDNFQLLNEHILGSGTQHIINVNSRVVGTGNLTNADKQMAFTNDVASGLITYGLPAAASGLEYSFLVDKVGGLKINSIVGGGVIRVGPQVTASSGNITSTTVGAAITLLAISTGIWVAIELMSSGNWTIN